MFPLGQGVCCKQDLKVVTWLFQHCYCKVSRPFKLHGLTPQRQPRSFQFPLIFLFRFLLLSFRFYLMLLGQVTEDKQNERKMEMGWRTSAYNNSRERDLKTLKTWIFLSSWLRKKKKETQLTDEFLLLLFTHPVDSEAGCSSETTSQNFLVGLSPPVDGWPRVLCTETHTKLPLNCRLITWHNR